MHSNYHAPHFDPTVDELETLKQLELGRSMDLPQALKEHLSGRLLDRGLISKMQPVNSSSPTAGAS